MTGEGATFVFLSRGWPAAVEEDEEADAEAVRAPVDVVVEEDAGFAADVALLPKKLIMVDTRTACGRGYVAGSVAGNLTASRARNACARGTDPKAIDRDCFSRGIEGYLALAR